MFLHKARKLLQGLTNDDVHFMCIGTDRSTGDSLAPLIGTWLTKKGYSNVSGTLNNPVHAMNLTEKIAQLPEGKKIIAIDACLGEITSIGEIRIEKGSIKAGAGVGKDLPSVGDFAITGIVNVGGFMEYFVLQNTRLSLVHKMANEIVDGITQILPLENQVDRTYKNISRKLLTFGNKKKLRLENA